MNEDKILEEWRPIDGGNGRYEVSNYGKVRSFARKNHQGKILAAHPQDNGYLAVSLQIHGKQKLITIHRLVAQAFIQNPNNLPQINHKDEDKTNNCAWNLEWCTVAYNLAYGTAPQRRALSRSKPCIGTWPDGSERRFTGTSEAERQTGICHGHIGQVCNGIWKTAGKVKWRWEQP